MTQHYSFMLMIDNAILNYLEFACCSMLVLFLKRNQMFCVFRDRHPVLPCHAACSTALMMTAEPAGQSVSHI